MEWNELHNIVCKAVSTLEKDAAIEAFFTAVNKTDVVIRNSEILTQNRIEDAGVGIRAAVHSKVGFACTNQLTEEALTQTGKKAISIAKVSSEAPDFALFEPGQLPSVPLLYDDEVAEMTVDKAVDMAQRMITSCEDVDQRVIAKGGAVEFTSCQRGIVTSAGIDCEEPGTKAILDLGGVGDDNGEVTGFCFDFEFSRTKNVSPEKIGESVGKKIVAVFNPKPVTSFEGTVIFGPQAVSYQLTDALIDALKGESVVAGRSFWAGKIGEKVASDITVTDNGILENGFSSRTFDDEGYPSQNTVLLQNGVLKSYLHCATTAHALQQPNTGNASRSPGGFDMIRSIIGSGYRTTPEIYPSNMVITPGTKDKQHLIAEVEKGVLVESMDGFVQQGSGLISARLSQAFFIDHGEIQYPIKGGMVTGIAFDWFCALSGIGNDSKRFENAVVPSLRVEDVTVVGG
jgi:PmbA protein